jgi:hypothetical protein
MTALGRAFAAVAALAGLALAESAARAAEAPDCDGPTESRAPDPRCGEPLDGRAAAAPPASLQVARAALAAPRLVTGAVLWPVVKTTDAVEHYRVADWARAILTTDDGLIGVRPAIVYSTSFTPTAGARLFYRRLPGEGSEADLRFMTAGPDVMLGELGLRSSERLGLSWSATWNRRNDRLFAGIGPNSEPELVAAGLGIARYGSNALATEVHWRRELPWRLAIDLRSGYAHRDYQGHDVRVGRPVIEVFGASAEVCAARGLPAPCVDTAQLPGFYTGLRLVQAGGELRLDLREKARDGSGVSAALDAAYARGVDTDPSRHGVFGGELVGAIGGGDKVLLLRARGTLVERFGSAPVPFEALVTPSGRAGMRGFPEGRFRGESALVGTAEYRWYLSAYLDAALFVDVGTVAGPRFSRLDWDRWFPSFGLGFRYHRPKERYWESPPLDGIQFAYAPDAGFRFLFALAAF